MHEGLQFFFDRLKRPMNVGVGVGFVKFVIAGGGRQEGGEYEDFCGVFLGSDGDLLVEAIVA